jgi:hypothetical protein
MRAPLDWLNPLVCGALPLLGACGASAPALPTATEEGPPQAGLACEVEASEGVTAIRASEHGVAFAAASDDGLRVWRLQGSGCALSPDGTQPVAASALLDLDDAGNLYVFPAPSAEAGVVSTWLEDGGADGVVERVDTSGHVAPVVHAGRGIWAFGVAPAGDSFWVSACGTTGIFTGHEPDLTPALTPPDTLWGSMPSVLTEAHTLWSVGYRTCSPPETASPSCGFALTRTTPEGSEEVGTTQMDFGAGYQQAVLARCGARVCGVFPGAVVLWDAGGELTRTVLLGDLGAEPGAQILQATGNREGLYLLLEGPSGKRVMYLPTSAPEA